MQKILFIFLMTMHSFVYTNLDPIPQPQDALKIKITNNNAPQLTNNVEVYTLRKDQTDCSMFFGDQHVQCMKSLNKDDLKTNFIRLSVRAARFFLMQLSLHEYAEFLQNFSSEEWQIYWNSLNPNDQECMPRTKEEQECLIKRALKTPSISFWAHPICYFSSYHDTGTPQWWADMEMAGCCTEDLKKELAAVYTHLKRKMFKMNYS